MQIHQRLLAMRQAIQSGQAREKVEANAAQQLSQAGFAVDYAVVRTTELALPGAERGPRVALIAARLGNTRLIDNLEFEG